MANREFSPEPDIRTASPAPMAASVGRVEWRAALAAAAPLLVLGGITAAYGFLEGNARHPSLKLWGALLIAGLAPITLLLARSIQRRRRSLAASRFAWSAGTDRRDIARMVLAFLSVDAALIHFAVIEQHFTEFWLYGAFFVAVGLFELVWAVLVMAGPSRLLYALGAIVNALTIAAYVITRTVGLLVGPAAHETEKIGFGDLASTIFEAVLVLGSLLLLFRSWGRAPMRPASSEASIGTAAVLVMAPTVLALFSTVGGHPFVTPAG